MYSENKGADQLRSYCEADLCLSFRLGKNLVFSRGGLWYPSVCYFDRNREVFCQMREFHDIEGILDKMKEGHL